MKVLDGAGGGRRVTGGPVAVTALGVHRVDVKARVLLPGYQQTIGTVQLRFHILRLAGGCGKGGDDDDYMNTLYKGFTNLKSKEILEVAFGV